MFALFELKPMLAAAVAVDAGAADAAFAASHRNHHLWMLL